MRDQITVKEIPEIVSLNVANLDVEELERRLELTNNSIISTCGADFFNICYVNACGDCDCLGNCTSQCNGLCTTACGTNGCGVNTGCVDGGSGSGGGVDGGGDGGGVLPDIGSVS
jgi:hypothetical protein